MQKLISSVFVVLALAVFASPIAKAGADDEQLIGSWAGTIEFVAGYPSVLEVVFEKGETGVVGSYREASAGKFYPLGDIVLKGETISFTLLSTPPQFVNGFVEDGFIEGSFKLKDKTGKVLLTRRDDQEKK